MVIILAIQFWIISVTTHEIGFRALSYETRGYYFETSILGFIDEYKFMLIK